MRRVRVRIDQGDGQRLDAGVDQLTDDLLHLRAIDRVDDLAARAHPLVRLARVLERGRRIRLDHDDPARERAWRLRAGQVQDLLEALRRDQPDACALRLEQRVRRHRRSVHDVAQLLRRDAALLADAANADEHALGRVARRGRGLDAVEVPRLVVYEEQVGEGAADVHSEPVRHRAPLSLARDGRERAGAIDLPW